MVSAERQQWAAVKTDADAEQFIKTFEAARKPGFTEEVAKRAQMADKYLTVSKTPGSKTLRGKVIVLFGPPSGFEVTNRTAKGEHMMGRDSFVSAGTSDPRGGGQSPSDVVSAVQHADMSAKQIRTFMISYDGDKLPTPRAKSLAVAIDVDTLNDQESLVDRSQMSELDELFQAAASTWLVNK